MKNNLIVLTLLVDILYYLLFLIDVLYYLLFLETFYILFFLSWLHAISID